MKYAGSVNGAAAARVSIDELLPSRGVLQRDLIPFVTDRYQFNISPPVGPGVGPSPILAFGSGVFDPLGERIPIVQCVLFPDGVVILAKDTNYANVVLEDFMIGCDDKFGFHYGTAPIERLNLSQISVEFDDSFVQHISLLSHTQNLINGAIGRKERDYRLKRLAFGCDANADAQAGTGTLAIDQIMLHDFLIERRAGEPMEKNLFFCSAPMTTQNHLALLQNIENTAVHLP